MATRDRVEVHIASQFKPNKEQEPLARIADALEFIAKKLHHIEFDVEELQEGMHRVADYIPVDLTIPKKAGGPS